MLVLIGDENDNYPIMDQEEIIISLREDTSVGSSLRKEGSIS